VLRAISAAVKVAGVILGAAAGAWPDATCPLATCWKNDFCAARAELKLPACAAGCCAGFAADAPPPGVVPFSIWAREGRIGVTMRQFYAGSGI